MTNVLSCGMITCPVCTFHESHILNTVV